MAGADAAVREGMAAQLQALDEHLALGMPRLGWKVAINDPAMQRRLGLDGWVTGFLRGDRVFRSTDTYAIADGAMVLIEAEIAIRVGCEVPPDASVADGEAAIAAIAPAIELVDYARPMTGLATMLGHSVFHDAVVFGDERPPVVGSVAGPLAGPTVRCRGETVRVSDPALDPGPLGALVARVAAFLGAHGAALLAGDRIISGTFTQPLPVVTGDDVEVDFGALGGVSLRIA
jgi:2-keto-4-pentenoate hydratase